MRIIAKRTLREFWKKHADARLPLSLWYSEVDAAAWESFQELRQWYPTASWVENNRVVFKIKGNKYRLVARLNFDYQICWIRFIGTHAEYDTISAKNV